MQMVQHKGETSHFINFKSSVFKVKKMTMTKLANDLPSTSNARKCIFNLFSNWRHLFYWRYYLATLQIQRHRTAIRYTTQYWCFVSWLIKISSLHLPKDSQHGLQSRENTSYSKIIQSLHPELALLQLVPVNYSSAWVAASADIW